MFFMCQKDVTFGWIKTFSGTIIEQVIGYLYKDSLFVNQVCIEAVLTSELHYLNKLFNHKRFVKHCTNISFRRASLPALVIEIKNFTFESKYWTNYQSYILYFTQYF